MAKKTVVIVDGHESKTAARLTWDGKNIACDPPEFLDYLKKVIGSPKDGDKFLEKVMVRFKSGYLHAYQIGK